MSAVPAYRGTVRTDQFHRIGSYGRAAHILLAGYGQTGYAVCGKGGDFKAVEVNVDRAHGLIILPCGNCLRRNAGVIRAGDEVLVLTEYGFEPAVMLERTTRKKDEPSFRVRLSDGHELAQVEPQRIFKPAKLV
jgi:hypothetical protein